MRLLLYVLIIAMVFYLKIADAQVKNTSNTEIYINNNTVLYLSGLDLQNQANANFINHGMLVMAGNAIGRDIVNHGSFQSINGIVRMQGTTEQQLQGNSVFNIGTLVVDNGGNGVSITNTSGVRIHQNLTLTNGKLFTSNSSAVYFTTTANDPSETNANHIVGTAIMESRSVNTSAFGPFLNFSMTAGGDVGNLTLTRRTGNGSTTSRGFTPTSGIINPIGFEGLAVHWLVNITNTSPSLTRNMNFTWLSAWDNSKVLTNMQLWRTTTPFNINSPWTIYDFGPHDISSRSFGISNVPLSQLHNAWTFSDFFNPLLLSVLYFNVKKESNKAIIEWKASNEHMVKYYVIERSTCGKDFQKIGKVAPHASSKYEWTDEEISRLKGKLYYRIRIVQENQLESTTPIQIVYHDIPFDVTLYPNYCQEDCQLSIINPASELVQIQIYDNTGRKIASKTITAAEIKMNLSEIADLQNSGIYILECNNGIETRFIKFYR